MTFKAEIKVTTKQIEGLFKKAFPDNPLVKIVEIPESFINPIFVVTLASKEKYVLKINNPTWPMKQYREKVALELARTKTTVPVPKVFHADFSQTAIPYDFMILENIKGKNLRESLMQGLLSKEQFLSILDTLGSYLGQLHNITFDFFGDFTKNFITLPNTLKSYSGPFWGRSFSSWREAFSALCNDNLTWVDKKSFPTIRKDIPSLIQKFSQQLNQQPHGVFIHSDIQPTNILIKDGQISALVDFEWSYAGSPSFEMALTRAGLYFSAFPSLDHSTFSSLSSLSLEQLYSILYTGYAKTNPIPLLEEHPQLTDFIWLLYMVGSWLWIKQSSTSQELSQFDEDIKRIHSQLIS